MSVDSAIQSTVICVSGSSSLTTLSLSSLYCSIDAKNDADSLVYSTDKSLNEHRSKLSAEDITEIEGALKDTRKALEGDDGEALRAQTQKLQTAAMRIGSAMYKNTGGSSSSSDNSGSKPADGDGRTVDAEHSEPKSDKK